MNQLKLFVLLTVQIFTLSNTALAVEETFNGYLTPRTEKLLEEAASMKKTKLVRAGTPAAMAAGAVGGAVAAVVDHVWDKYVKGSDEMVTRKISPSDFDLYLSPKQAKIELDSLRTQMGESSFFQYISPKTMRLVELYTTLPDDFDKIESPLRDNLAAAAAGAAAGALAYKAVDWGLKKSMGSDAEATGHSVLETDFDL